ncbi:MAG: hypothetical protein JWM34_2346 [Ilumatobacteraceae bacterium]|nr:hypothetical protein [Ilumatobacteraceae bacterium]
MTPGGLAAARHRISFTERHQSFDQRGLWADLLSSPAMAFNLFGDLAADRALADRAVRTWWPDAPGAFADVRFAHSPGRLDLSFLGSLSAFDGAIVLDTGHGRSGIVGVYVRYHERVKRETPKPIRAAHYLAIAERSGAFRSDALADLCSPHGNVLLEMWLQHLLVLAMLQHEDRRWSWGRLVVVHAAGNADQVEACAHYRSLLTDPSTFAAVTIEELLDAEALPVATTAALRERYL